MKKHLSIIINCFIIINLSFFPYSNCSTECNDNCINNGLNCVNKGSNKCDITVCKPSIINKGNGCFSCPSVIKTYSINNGNCENTCTGNKIVYSTNECVESCGELYTLGDFCFREPPSDTINEIPNEKILKCANKYYIEEKDKKNIIIV